MIVRGLNITITRKDLEHCLTNYKPTMNIRCYVNSVDYHYI